MRAKGYFNMATKIDPANKSARKGNEAIPKKAYETLRPLSLRVMDVFGRDFFPWIRNYQEIMRSLECCSKEN